jgi:hypothetical protein
MKLGLDFGNVIKLHGEEFPYNSINGINDLRSVFGEDIYIISRVNNNIGEQYVRKFMELYYENFKIPQNKIFFCLEKREKGPIASRLEITHFVDDRPECLYYMNCHIFCMNPIEDDLKEFPIDTIVKNWGQVLREVRKTIYGFC